MKKLSLGLALSICLSAVTLAMGDNQANSSPGTAQQSKTAPHGACCKEGSATAAQATKVKPYALADCIVTGEKLGSMGAPYVHKHDGQEVKFCCKGCLKSFNKQPAKYLAKLDETPKASKSSSSNK